MVAKNSKPITIIGAGLAGAFLALLLAKRGYKVTIYESLSKKDIADTSSRRSFNLTFYHYGMQALKKAGVWDTVKPLLINLKGSVTQISKNTAPIFARFDYDNMPYFAVQRAKLLNVLLQEAARQPLVTIHFDTNVLSIDRYEKTLLIQHTKSKKLQTVSTEVILGTDGVNSQVRTSIQQGLPTHHMQEYEQYEYKQIIITKEMAEEIKLLPDTQHAWTRKHETLIAFPNGDESFTGMLILPKDEKYGFASLQSEEQIQKFITEIFPDFLPVLSELTMPLIKNPKGYFVTVFTNPWYYKDFMALFGDAAHGCLPFYGVGMSVAFGDCMEFVALVDKYGANWGKIFPLYQEMRKKNTDVIARLAKESFVGFRRYKRGDKVAIYDRFDALLHTMIPRVFRPPLFNLVANDPNNALEYLQHHLRQRKLVKYVGLPILVTLLAQMLELKERITKK